MSKEELKFIISIFVILNRFGLTAHVKDIMLKTLVWFGGNLQKILLTHCFLQKKFIEDVHEIWTKHFYDQLHFEQYGANFEKTEGKPMFLTINTSNLKTK